MCGVVSVNPEKEIVNLWLNKNGFFTISGINARNRVIDIMAIRQGAEKEIQHVEVNCSVSSGMISDKEKNELSKKFSDANVEKTVKETIKKLVGKDADYEKILITTNSNAVLPGVKTIDFNDVLLEVMMELDRQNYRNSTIRTMQLIKYLLLTNPKFSKLLVSDEKYKALKHSSREHFIRELLSQDASKKVFKKQLYEQILVDILKYSTLKQPERLAKALDEVMTTRTSNRFVDLLLKQKNVRAVIKKKVVKNQKSLAEF